MKAVVLLLAFAASAACAFTASAQTVKGNEAVTVLPDGSKRIETPPLPSGSLGKPCPAAQAGCTGAGWLMLETNDGLSECTELYARRGSCRPSTFGNEKRSRLWIVKSRSQWLQCQHPDLSSKCVSITSLAVGVVQ